MSPSVRWLHNGRKLHLQHGPIDLIIEVTGHCSDAERAACQRAIDRFDTVLTELVAELPALKSRTNRECCRFEGSIANRMWEAANRCESHCSHSSGFHRSATTPMIAVAGAVADEVLTAIIGTADDAQQLNRISVNNGGDIAIYLDATSRYRVGVVANPVDACLSASLALRQPDRIQGIATSGWRGRSFSFGIADSVTVLAANAATADAAATLIANAVTFESKDEFNNTELGFVERRPAVELYPDSDLGSAMITTNVRALPPSLIECALNAGSELATHFEQQRLIAGACIFLQGSYRILGKPCNPIIDQLADAKVAVSANFDSAAFDSAAIEHQETQFQQETA